MSNEMQLQVFKNSEFNDQVRVLGTADDPKFCLPDICKVLELNPSKVAQRLEKGVLSKYTLQTKGGAQKINFVNEDGFYDVVLASRKPIAKKFRKWVTSEVLPSIRKTGEYKIKDSTNDQQLLLQQAVRKEGKIYRHEYTDAIKQLCICFDLVGTKEEDITYGKYTNLVYRIIRVPKGMRDSFDAVTLMTIANMELIAADEIMRCLVQGLDKGQIYCAVSKRLIAYAQTAMLQERIDNKLAFLGKPAT